MLAEWILHREYRYRYKERDSKKDAKRKYSKKEEIFKERGRI
jgi:hypothetical protein